MSDIDAKQESKEAAKKLLTPHKRSLSYSFKYAGRGILKVFRSERSFRLQLVIFALTVVTGLAFQITATEWIFIVLVSSMVLVSEMINTIIEYVVDLITEEYSIQAKYIKNIAAGAVLVSSLLAIVIGLIVFVPYFIEFF
ncbi:Undecaprenol kinase [subsurface metagenome]